MAITLRSVKGSALTQAELDANFTTLNAGVSGDFAIAGTASIGGGVLQTGTKKVRIENTSASVPTGAAGVGVEFGVDTGVSVVMSYNRTTTAYAPLLLNALSHSIQTGAFGEAIGIASDGAITLPGTLKVGTIGAFAASDKYLVVDSSGNIHKSATGPGS